MVGTADATAASPSAEMTQSRLLPTTPKTASASPIATAAQPIFRSPSACFTGCVLRSRDLLAWPVIGTREGTHNGPLSGTLMTSPGEAGRGIDRSNDFPFAPSSDYRGVTIPKRPDQADGCACRDAWTIACERSRTSRYGTSGRCPWCLFMHIWGHPGLRRVHPEPSIGASLYHALRSRQRMPVWRTGATDAGQSGAVNT
jgi:hypothetical protein